MSTYKIWCFVAKNWCGSEYAISTCRSILKNWIWIYTCVMNKNKIWIMQFYWQTLWHNWQKKVVDLDYISCGKHFFYCMHITIRRCLIQHFILFFEFCCHVRVIFAMFKAIFNPSWQLASGGQSVQLDNTLFVWEIQVKSGDLTFSKYV